MSLTYRTYVAHLEATPLGMVPERWVVDHVCTRCKRRVAGDELVAHARAHHDDDGGEP